MRQDDHGHGHERRADDLRCMPSRPRCAARTAYQPGEPEIVSRPFINQQRPDILRYWGLLLPGCLHRLQLDHAEPELLPPYMHEHPRFLLRVHKIAHCHANVRAHGHAHGRVNGSYQRQRGR